MSRIDKRETRRYLLLREVLDNLMGARLAM
jgi:hypothetical protein